MGQFSLHQPQEGLGPQAAATREGASTMEGTKMTTGDANTSRTESPGPAKMVGAKKKKYRHERSAAS